jgi:hypothetical protein
MDGGKPNHLASPTIKNAPPPTSSAPALDLATVEKAALISCSLLALTVMIFCPMARAAFSISRDSVWNAGEVGSCRTAMVSAYGFQWLHHLQH